MLLRGVDWSRQEFGSASWGDKRRTERAVKVGSAMALDAACGVLLPSASADEAKAAYRLFSEANVAHSALTLPHRSRVISSAGGCAGPVLFVHDDTVVDFAGHAAMKGIGPVGDHHGRGLMAHSCLALTPQRGVLGMAHQAVWAREEDKQPGASS